MKVLWGQRGIPDNHVHGSFLSQLRQNHNVVGYQPSTLTGDAGVLLVGVTVAINFLLTFVAIYNRGVNPFYQLGLWTVISLMLLAKWLATQRPPIIARTFKSLAATLVSVVGLTPVFRSLTESVSSDSIWAITGWLILVNVIVSSRRFLVLSVTTALAATIVLASRLPDSLSVFYFTLASIESFVVLPTVYKWVRVHDPKHIWEPGLLSVVSVYSWLLCWYILGGLFLATLVALQLGVLCGVPQMFLFLQKHKDRISGPWDMARPILD